MITKNQPILPSTGLQNSSWIKPFVTLIVAIGMLFTWGARAHAQSPTQITGTAGNSTAAVIIDNELQALNVITPSSISADFAGATAAQLENALIAALNQFPAPNGVVAADNPDYTGTNGYGITTYHPEDLSNYILAMSSTPSTIAATVVKDAIATLQAGSSVYGLGVTGTSQYAPAPASQLAPDDEIGKIAGDAAAILAIRMPLGGFTQAQVGTAVDTLLANTIKTEPSAAMDILDTFVSKVQTPPTISGGTALTGTTITQTVAVDALLQTIKSAPAASQLLVAGSATTALGTFFTNAALSGTVNQSFIIAAVKGAPTTIPLVAQTITAAGEALATGGPAITTATGAAAYVTPILLAVPAGDVAAVAQATAGSLASVANQALFAELVTTGTGSVGPTLGATKATPTVDGEVLGGVIANNPSQENAIVNDSSIYKTIDTSVKLGTDSNRISFVDAVFTAIATGTSGGAAAIDNLLSTSTNTGGTVFAATSNTFNIAKDFNALVAGATKAVIATPSYETNVVTDLLGNDPDGVDASLPALTGTFAAIAVKNAGTAGAIAYEAVMANDSVDTTPATQISFALNHVATNVITSLALNDAARAQLAVGLIHESDIQTSGSTGTAFTDIDNTIAAADTDAAKAVFVSTVANAFLSGSTALDGVLNAAFNTSITNHFSSEAVGAADVAKALTTSTSATTVAYYASLDQGAVTSSAQTSFTTDAAIAQAMLGVATIKANATLAANVVQTVANMVVAQDSTQADYSLFASDIVGSTLSTESTVISQGISAAMKLNSDTDAQLEAFGQQMATNLVTASKASVTYQVAGGIAPELTTGSSVGLLAVDVAFATGSNTATAAVRGKIGQAAAFTSSGTFLVTDLISGDGQLNPLTTLGDKDTVGIDVAVNAAADAGAIAGYIAGTLHTDATGYADIGTSAGAITKAISGNAARATDIPLIVDNTIDVTTASSASTILNSGSANVLTYLYKAAGGAGAAGGDLFAKEVATDMASLYSFSSSSDTPAMNAFVAFAGTKAAAAEVYIAQGFAEFIPTVDQPGFAQAAALASGTTATAGGIKGLVAEGVALADPSQAPTIASDVASTVVDALSGVQFTPGASPTTAQAKEELANNTARTTIAVDVAKATPALAMDITYNIGIVLDNTGAGDTAFATFAKDIAAAVDGVLPKANLAEQLGAIASEALLAAHQVTSNPLTVSQLAAIAKAVATVKAGTTYEVVGASIATAATFLTNSQLTDASFGFEHLLVSSLPSGADAQQGADAQAAYTNNADAFDIGPVTRPETGVQNS